TKRARKILNFCKGAWTRMNSGIKRNLRTAAKMRTAGQILLVDDDQELCSLMADFFSQHGFELEAAHDGRGGLARALEPGFDVIILDVMLPVLDGFEVLAQIRRRSSVPVIMLTARTGQQDRIDGLDAGADDYLPK